MPEPDSVFSQAIERHYSRQCQSTTTGTAGKRTGRRGTIADRPKTADTIRLAAAGGTEHLMDLAAVDQVISWACEGISGVNPDRLAILARGSLRNGMRPAEVGAAIVMAVRPLIGTGPGYSQVCARLLLDSLWGEVSAALGKRTAHGGDFRLAEYPGLFKSSVARGIELALLPADLQAFDLDHLAAALQPERDRLLSYAALQDLCDRQLLQSGGIPLELPQACFMRVAMGLALKDRELNERAVELYEELSQPAGES